MPPTKIPRPVSKQPIPEHAKSVFKGAVFEVFQWQQPQFNLTMKTYEKVTRPDVVNVLPVSKDNRIILAKQQQPGTAPFIGALGGQMDPGETPEEAAARELLEESGYKAGRLILWEATQPWVKVDCAIYTFIAKNVEQVSQPHLDGGEKIELIEVKFDEFMDLAAQDNFRDTEIALKLFRLSRNPIKMEALRSLFQD